MTRSSGVIVGVVAALALAGCASSSSARATAAATIATSVAPTVSPAAGSSIAALSAAPVPWLTMPEAQIALAAHGLELMRMETSGHFLRATDPVTGAFLEIEGYPSLYVDSITVMTDSPQPASIAYFMTEVEVFAPGARDWVQQWLALPAAQQDRATVRLPVAGSTAVAGRHPPTFLEVMCQRVDVYAMCIVRPE